MLLPHNIHYNLIPCRDCKTYEVLLVYYEARKVFGKDDDYITSAYWYRSSASSVLAGLWQGPEGTALKTLAAIDCHATIFYLLC